MVQNPLEPTRASSCSSVQFEWEGTGFVPWVPFSLLWDAPFWRLVSFADGSLCPFTASFCAWPFIACWFTVTSVNAWSLWESSEWITVFTCKDRNVWKKKRYWMEQSEVHWKGMESRDTSQFEHWSPRHTFNSETLLLALLNPNQWSVFRDLNWFAVKPVPMSIIFIFWYKTSDVGKESKYIGLTRIFCFSI